MTATAALGKSKTARLTSFSPFFLRSSSPIRPAGDFSFSRVFPLGEKGGRKEARQLASRDSSSAKRVLRRNTLHKSSLHSRSPARKNGSLFCHATSTRGKCFPLPQRTALMSVAATLYVISPHSTPTSRMCATRNSINYCGLPCELHFSLFLRRENAQGWEGET